ncbi:hypothetical protein OAO87_01855 [bacterium]|nr:hypothetical protein [bacterium]
MCYLSDAEISALDAQTSRGRTVGNLSVALIEAPPALDFPPSNIMVVDQTQVEMTRRLVLVGIFVLVERGSMVQIAGGAIFCAIYLLIITQAGPYLERGDDFLANAASFSLLVFFICCNLTLATHMLTAQLLCAGNCSLVLSVTAGIFYKMSEMTDLQLVRNILTPKQRLVFDVREDVRSIVLIGCVLFSLVISFVMLLVQLSNERARMAREALAYQKRRLRYKVGHAECQPPDIAEKHFHAFLSQ